MPMYEYSCGSCGGSDERVAPIAERDSQDCAECGARLVRTEICATHTRVDSFMTHGAILSNGQFVEGNFGARRDRGRSKGAL